MPVKPKGRRTRYVVLRVVGGPPPKRHALKDAIAAKAEAAGIPSPQLTAYEDGHAFLRTTNGAAPRLREALRRLEVKGTRLEPVGTSGTLRSAKGRWGPEAPNDPPFAEGEFPPMVPPGPDGAQRKG